MMGTNDTASTNSNDHRPRRALRAGIALAIAAAGYLLAPESCPEPARRVIFIFLFAALFWAMEIIPLFATSMAVILLSIFTLSLPGGVLGMGRGGFREFLNPFSSPIIILFFGGFVLAAALHKYGLDRIIARRLMRIFGRRPLWIMVGLMFTTAFLSMWMSNTATAAMMMVMIRPLYEQLDRDDPFRVSLVLAVPFGANIGGIGTPVGTPPNAIALGILAQQDPPITIGFLRWMMMAIPLAVVLLILASAILFFLFRPKHRDVHLEIKPGKSLGRPGKQVAGIALFTVLMWLTSELHKLPEAVVGFLGAGLYAAFGLLDKEDFKKLDWDVLILMWGGLTLGHAMSVSGLSNWIVSLPLFDQSGWLLYAIACFMAVFMSTVMSNTATATLLVPIVIILPAGDPVMLAITVAVSCSFAMALPVSTPPNAIAFASNVIHSRDLLKAGSMVSVVSLVLLLLTYRILMPLALGR